MNKLKNPLLIVANGEFPSHTTPLKILNNANSILACDGAADTLPIVSIYKTQVRELAKHLEIDEKIITKKSSPHLWPNHEAEHEIGVEYEQIDSILYCLIDKKLSVEDTAKESQIDIKIVEKIYSMYKNSEHKRITPKAF